jgi:hypothetical protein
MPMHVEGCDMCQGEPLPGLITRDERDVEGVQVIYLERCDTCAIYPGDLEAASALAHRLGGKAYFLQDEEQIEVRGPGPYPAEWRIDTGTDPWVEVEHGTVRRRRGDPHRHAA